MKCHFRSGLGLVYACLLFLNMSCSEKKEQTVPLEELHEYYQVLAEEIPGDLLRLCKEENSLRQILDKSYMTPKMHSSIMGFWGPYNGVCQVIENELGEIRTYTLSKIVKTELVYHFVYELTTGNTESKAILKLVLNKSYGLSEFHIFKATTAGYVNILFPDSRR